MEGVHAILLGHEHPAAMGQRTQAALIDLADFRILAHDEIREVDHIA
jgi:hypothetical protein